MKSNSSQLDFLPDGTPIIVGGDLGTSGLPIGSIVWDTLGIPEYGFLNLSMNNGDLSVDVFPELAAKIIRAKTLNANQVLTFAQYDAEISANKLVGKYALNTTQTLFRVPRLNISNQTGTIATSGTDTTQLLGKTGFVDVATGVGWRYNSTFYYPMLKAYGGIINQGNLDIGALANQYATKLDTSVYEDFKNRLIQVDAVVNSDGTLITSYNVTSCVRNSQGNYTMAFSTAIPFPFTPICTSQAATVPIGIRFVAVTDHSMTWTCQNPAGTAVDSNTYIAIFSE